MSEKTTPPISIGVPGLLTLIFIVLKLTHSIDWSWWWITAPLWIPATVAITVLGIVIVIKTIVR